MATYTIKGNDNENFVNFAPENEVDEIKQNVRTIINTLKYQIPLDREFGINGSVIDLPVNHAKAKYTNEIFQAIKTYEPRAVIENVEFDGDSNGRLMPKVVIKIETG